MFTGIVVEVGTIQDVREEGNGVVCTISCQAVLDGLGLGDSVAIDGACLTVTSILDHAFTVQAVGTTLGRTTFGGFEAGRRVNLERALSLGQRLGGHIVQGHVDGLGEVISIRREEELVLIDFRMPADVASVTVLHGSITLNGISLTVNALPAPDVCQVSIIPFTWEHTNLAELSEGDAVNLEGDTIGKYVRHLLGMPAAQSIGGAAEPEHVMKAWGY
ncbi:riboflavin synthase [Longimicrobium sp.]|uniref:riboflavin synthase n=1 Tax=Longimicrobium sp. TaxID=2029185 RepID=UPI002C24E0ED|nr:riboflavin synthase [Longimicrobium sp.]HSU13599.1 riboflavin synthase [Longimicrobium sp.]